MSELKDVPLKTSLDEFIGTLDEGAGRMAARAKRSVIAAQLATGTGTAFPTWAGLVATVGTYAGQRAEVYGDVGTHTDPVVGGTVSNSGVFGWSTAPAGWQRLGSDLYTVVAAEEASRIADVDAEEAARIAADALLSGQIAALTTQLLYLGAWNASTNSPSLASSVGTANTYYIVSTAGSTNLNGTSSWAVGDWAIFSGGTWKKQPNPFTGQQPLYLQGTAWNASSNSPSLASSVGTEGFAYRVGTAGSTTLNGIASWNIGDWAVFHGGSWRKIRGETVNAANIADSTTAGRALLTAASVAAQRTALGIDSIDAVTDANKTVTPAVYGVAYVDLTATRTVTLDQASTFPAGTRIPIFDETGFCHPTRQIVINCNAADTINGDTSLKLVVPFGGVMLFRVSSTSWTAVPFSSYLDWLRAPPPKRQCANAGPTNFSTGVASFLPASATGLAITSTGINTASLIVAAAGGNDPQGVPPTGLVRDRVGLANANITWSSLTANATNYLMLTVNADGTLTPWVAVSATYQFYGVGVATNNAFTFNIFEMKGYKGNGSIAIQGYHVCVGEAVTNSSDVTSTISYAYNGYFDSGFTSTLPTSGSTTKNANLGTPMPSVRLILECTTIDNNYAVGDVITEYNAAGSSSNLNLHSASRGNVVGFAVGGTWGANDKSTGSAVNLTVARWKYKFIATRGW
jgi:hypothetical protein